MPVRSLSSCRHPRGELGMGVDARCRPRCRRAPAPRRPPAAARGARPRARPVARSRRTPARGGSAWRPCRWVRPIFTMRSNSAAFSASASRKRGKRRDRSSSTARARGDVHGRRDDVVGRLAHVHVIVRDGPAVAAAARARGAIGDHLVGVHVGRGARAGLEHVDDEVRVEARRSTTSSAASRMRRRARTASSPSSAFTSRRGVLDQAERVDEAAREAIAADRKVLDGALGRRPPQRVRRARASRPSNRARSAWHHRAWSLLRDGDDHF